MRPLGRFLSVAAFLVFAGAFGFEVWSAEQCRYTQDCGGYQRAHEGGAHQSAGLPWWYPTDAIGLYTLLLAVFTAGLTVASVWQGYFLVRADRTARTAADAALKTAQTASAQVGHLENSAAEAKRAADAMNALASAAETQTTVLFQQADILEKQKEIARLQFFAEHRPRLILKDVYFTQDRNYKELAFEISNVGGSAARIIDGFTYIGFVTDLREFKTKPSGSLPEIPQKAMGAGEIRTCQLTVPQSIQGSVSNSRFRIDFPDAARIRNLDAPPEPGPAVDLYFFGLLRYADQRGEEFGAIRACVFRREWDVKSSSFRRTNNPDHESSD